MTKKIDEILSQASSRVILLDGGMGSTVEDRGVPVRNELWGSYALMTSEGRAVNDAAHRDFVEAGAEILIANTHNASLTACEGYVGPGAPKAAEKLLGKVNRRAVESARRAVPEGAAVAVAAGIGSAEGAYAEEGRLPPGEVADRLAPQARVLSEIGVDLLLFETLTTPSEIEGLARLARRENLGPVGVGLTCREDGRTLGGVTMAQAVGALQHASPVAFFVQCTAFGSVLPALRALVSEVGDSAVVGVYANDGRSWIDMRWHGERVPPEVYAELAVTWRDAGARIIGGCCGTGPEHVAALSRALVG